MSVLITTLTLNPAIDRTVTISNFTAATVNRVEHASDRAGGKGINVAATLAAHGYPVAALGFIGQENQAIFTSFMAQRGITDRCLRLLGTTRVGIKIFDPLRRETTDINFPGLTPSAGDMAALREQLSGLEGGWCVLGGSLPLGVPSDFYAELITLLKKRGVRTVLDTSGAALREALRAAPYIVKPNLTELEAVVGHALPTQSEVIAVARAWVAGGVRLVVVSCGAEGACFVSADEEVWACPPVVNVKSTVGAGDAMLAGVLAAQLRGFSLADTARLATAYALVRLTSGDATSAGGEEAAVHAWAARVVVTAL